MMPAIILLLTLFFGTCQGFKECDNCKAFLGNMIKMVENDKFQGDPNDLSSVLCLNEQDCSQKVQYLGYLKAIILKKKITANSVCEKLQLCIEDNAGLQQKLILVFIEMAHTFLELVRNQKYDWNNCEQNYNQVTTPFVNYILENQKAIRDAGFYFCESDLVAALVQPRTCRGRVNDAVALFEWNAHSFSYVCNTSLSEESYNRQKLIEIKNAIHTDNLKKTQKVRRDKAKVHEVISDTKEMLPYVVTSDGDINALCTMCIFFIQKYPAYKARLTRKLEDVVRIYFFGGVKKDRENRAMVVIQRIFYDWFSKFDSIIASEMSSCTDSPMMACSSESYGRVSEVLQQVEAKIRVGDWRYSHERAPACGSCDSLSSYLAPILQKPEIRKDLTDHLFETINKFYSLTSFDNIGIAVYPILEKIMNNVADFIVEHKHDTCQDIVFCKD